VWWWHQINLGNGVVTPGLDRTIEKIAAVGLSNRLDGMAVLDIGAWDGAFSFECERRGARRVVAADHHVWRDGGDAGFRYAHRVLGSKVERVDVRVEDLSPEVLGTFDLVLFLGVLYHSEDPMRYLRRVRAMCRTGGKAIIETVVDGDDYPRPVMVFYPGATLGNDPTNFWGPNVACVEAMLREVGFGYVRMTSQWMPNRCVFHATVR
jgi:tRNA (mo5U34)-methyltransferase